jgi:hypothetical protein
MQMLDTLLGAKDPMAAERYRRRAFKLVGDTLRACRTGKASVQDAEVCWGEGGWETILTVSLVSPAALRELIRLALDHKWQPSCPSQENGPRSGL